MASAFATASGMAPDFLYLLIAAMVQAAMVLFAAWQTWRLFVLWKSKKIDYYNLKSKIIMIILVPVIAGSYLYVA